MAAGPWSWRVCRSLPFDVPVRGVRGWILVTRPAPFRLRHAIEEEWTRPAPPAPTLAQLAEGSEPEPYVACVLQQDFAGRVLIGSSLHGATSDADESPETLTAIAQRAVALMPALAGLAIAERRSCQRPFSPDLLPLLGPYPGVGGLILATGHGSVGVTQSLGSGEVVAEESRTRSGIRLWYRRGCSHAFVNRLTSRAGSRASADLRGVGVQAARELDGIAQRHHVPAGDLVGRDAEPLPRDAALELGREEAVVAADEHLDRDLGPALERARLPNGVRPARATRTRPPRP